MVMCPCPKCGEEVSSDDDFAQVKCRACGTSFRAAEILATVALGHRPAQDEDTDHYAFADTVDSTARGNSSTSVDEPDLSSAPDIPGVDLLQKIGAGGYGAVFRAVEGTLDREVAVKILHRDRASEDERNRFVSEAIITGNLQHPNIVPIHSLGLDQDGSDYFTMKVVEGNTLTTILDKLHAEDTEVLEAYGMHRLLNIFMSICDAVAYAHSQRVVHRDLKPDNIMLGDFGEVFVMDWGIAKVVLSEDEDSASSSRTKTKTGAAASASDTDFTKPDTARPQTQKRTFRDRFHTRLTQFQSNTMYGTIMGTPGYMCPEQADGRMDDVDERGDVYSLGVILYELLSLRLPVAGKDAVELIRKTAKGDLIPLRHKVNGRVIPPEVAAIVRKAMALSPERRYASAGALAQDVRNYLEDREVSVHPDRPLTRLRKWSRRNRALATGLVAGVSVTIIAVVGLLLMQLTNAQREAKAQASLVQLEREKSTTEKQRAEAEQQKNILLKKEQKRLLAQASAWTLYEKGRDITSRLGSSSLGIKLFAEQAEQAFSQAIKADPGFTQAYFERANVRKLLQRYMGAIEDFGKVNELTLAATGKGHAKALRLAGDTCRDARNEDLAPRAMGYYKRAAKADPADPHAKLAMVIVTYYAGKRDEAIRKAKKLTTAFPNLWEGHYMLGFFYSGFLKHGKVDIAGTVKPDYPNAIQAFSSAIRLKPDKASAYYNRGACYVKLYQATRKPTAVYLAKENLNVAAMLDPTNLRVRFLRLQLAVLTFDAYYCYVDSAELKAAYPNHPYVLAGQAVIQYNQKNFKQARSAINAAIKQSPDNQTFRLIQQKIAVKLKPSR